MFFDKLFRRTSRQHEDALTNAEFAPTVNAWALARAQAAGHDVIAGTPRVGDYVVVLHEGQLYLAGVQKVIQADPSHWNPIVRQTRYAVGLVVPTGHDADGNRSYWTRDMLVSERDVVRTPATRNSHRVWITPDYRFAFDDYDAEDTRPYEVVR